MHNFPPHPHAGFNNHADFKLVFFFHASESSATMRAMGIELGIDEDDLWGAAVIRRAAQDGRHKGFYSNSTFN